MIGNKYINDTKPWDKETDEPLAKQCIIDIGVLLSVLIRLYSVIIPATAQKAQHMRETKEKIILFTKVSPRLDG